MRRLLTILCLTLMCCLYTGAQTKQQTRRKATAAKTAVQPKKKSGTSTATSKKTGATTAKKGKQSTPDEVTRLKKDQAKLQKKIKKQKELKQKLASEVSLGLRNLMALDTEIARQRNVLDTISKNLLSINANIDTLDRQLDELRRQLDDRKQRYIKSLRAQRRTRSVEDQLMFVFAADDLNQMYRRMRFNRTYATFQRAQGEAVKSKQAQIAAKRNELAQARKEQTTLLARNEHEQKVLEDKQTAQQQQVKDLKKQQATAEAILAEQMKKDRELSASIREAVQREIARQRAIAEAEAKRKAEEARRRAQAEEKRHNAEEARNKRSQGKEPTTGKSTTARNNNKRSHNDNSATASNRKRPRSTDFVLPDDDRKLSSSFESNKGRLPVPIAGAYRLLRGVGAYKPEGIRGRDQVVFQSDGLHYEVKPGTDARSIFNGEVSAVLPDKNGGQMVMIRHGRYISVYCGLSSVAVRQGQKVSTRQTLGRISQSGLFQFQLYNWERLLNPAHWLGR